MRMSSYPSHPASAEPYCHTDVVQPAFRHERRVMAAMENALLSASKAVSKSQSFLRNFPDLHHVSKSGASSFHIQSIHRSPISMSDSSIVSRLPRLPIGRERTATPLCLHLLKRLAGSHSRKDTCINDIKPNGKVNLQSSAACHRLSFERVVRLGPAKSSPCTSMSHFNRLICKPPRLCLAIRSAV